MNEIHLFVFLNIAPLHITVGKGYIEIVKHLLNHSGINVNDKLILT